MATFSFSAGLINRGQVRRFLEKEQFAGNIQFIESKGWIDSEFTVKGDNGNVSRVFKALHDYQQRLEAE